MAFLGLDSAARKTGIGLVGDDGHVLVAQTIIAGRRRGAERLAYIRAQAFALIDACPEPLRGGAIEGASYGSTHREFTLGEVSGVLRGALYERGLDLTVVPPALLKKFAVGRGQATKEQILYAVRVLWDHVAVDDNAADAIVLAQIARARVIPPTFYRHQAEVVATLQGMSPLRLAHDRTTLNV